MILGNSGGRNKGKKYLDRGNLDNKRLAADDYARLDDFNTWYVDSYDSLVQQWVNRNSYDEDVFSETYARICESLLYTAIQIADYKSYFCRAYYTNLIQMSMKENRYTLPEGYMFSEILDDTDDSENNNKHLISEVLKFVRSNFSEFHYHIYITYLSLEPTRSYAELAKVIPLKEHQLQFIISRIKKAIRKNSELSSKRISYSYKSTLKKKI